MSEEMCPVTAVWEDQPLRCHLAPGHRTLLEHLDKDRGLRWIDGRSAGPHGTVYAWPGTEEDQQYWLKTLENDAPSRGRAHASREEDYLAASEFEAVLPPIEIPVRFPGCLLSQGASGQPAITVTEGPGKIPLGHVLQVQADAEREDAAE